MFSFPNLKLVCCSMSSSNCCFLTCIQISQEASKVVWYSHLLKNFPQFVVIHTVKGFSIVNEIEVDVFWNFLVFFMIQWMLAIWSLVPLPFLNPAVTSGSSLFTYCWRLAWRIFSITLLTREMNATVWVVWTFFGITFLWDWNENWLFQSCGHCRVFQICWHIECSTFTASSLRIWNSSAGIPSPLLVLLVVILPKAHLTHTPGCLAPGEWSHHRGYLGH